ncbi:Hypothetical protein PHPALM_37364 [Phytophthora palmivora]|uniref:Uncharacterized protein n=1 Tax=Phytophthora palmivora TaxID=4796 RepID=A0A2P4WXM2_9STRA|nr:Hypothetical protein PHPALM_37364 [Phytophthora palmivora]
MNFLVSAGSIETLEEATRQLRKLVERVQVYLQKKKNEFALNQGRVDAAGTDSVYLQQRGQSPSHFVARRRVRRYPDPSRWMSRSYPGHGEAGYAMYTVTSPQGGSEQPQRIRARQPLHIYQGTLNRFPRSFEFDDSDDMHDAEFPEYAETADLTNENAGTSQLPQFVDVQGQHLPVHRAHPRRSHKRPLSKMRNDGPLPPPIYRQRMPYIYDYSYEDEDDEWMSEDDELSVAYGCPPQFHPVEIPIVRRRRRFDSVNSQHWNSPAGREHQQIYKRRRIPRNDSSREIDTSDNSALDEPNCEQIIPSSSRARTSFVDQLDEVADNAGSGAYSGHGRNFAEIPTEDSSTVSSSSDIDTNTVMVNRRKSVIENVTTENTSEVLTDMAANPTPNSSVRDTMIEQGTSIPNDEVLRSVIDKTPEIEQPEQHLSSEPAQQSEGMPLNSTISIPETAGPQISMDTTSSLTRYYYASANYILES